MLIVVFVVLFQTYQGAFGEHSQHSRGEDDNAAETSALLLSARHRQRQQDRRAGDSQGHIPQHWGKYSYATPSHLPKVTQPAISRSVPGIK